MARSASNSRWSPGWTLPVPTYRQRILQGGVLGVVTPRALPGGRHYDSTTYASLFNHPEKGVSMMVEEVIEDNGGAVEDTAEASRRAQSGESPPYMSFTSFLTLLDRIEENGPPNQFDRSFFGNISGSIVAQNMGTLRFFGLLDGKVPRQPLLSSLTSPAGRKAVLRQLIEEKYPEAVRLGEQRGTAGQLDQTFKDRGLNGATVRKAVTFYLQAADYAGIPVSPHFSKPRPPVSSGTRRPAASRRGSRKGSTPEPAPTTPASAPTDKETQRSRYIDMLMGLVEKSEQPDAGLLDRIERAIGIEGEHPSHSSE
jgi:hypothetical protein